jgi:hypothetical protein
LRPLRKAFLDIQEQSAIFGSQLLLNASLFIIMTVASLKMDHSEFAVLALGMNSITFLSNCLDVGLNHSSLKLAIERDSWSFIAINIALKAVIFAVAIVCLILSALLFSLPAELIVVAAAASAAFWSTTRLVEQHARNFMRLAALNLFLTVTRITFGAVAILTGKWMFVALAVHVVAPLPIHLFTSLKTLRVAVSSIKWRDVVSLGALSPIMFASGSLFNALPLMTQGMIYDQGDTSSAAAFGVALLFTTPMVLVAMTVRLYILPQALTNHHSRIDLFGLGPKSSHVLALAVALMLLAGMGILSLVINAIYSERLPQSTEFFLIYGGCFSAALVLGLYNIGVLRGSLMRLDLATNILRAGLTWALAWPGTFNALDLVVWSGAIMVGGEIFLLCFLTLVRRSEDV